jgi:hypothetical protein
MRKANNNEPTQTVTTKSAHLLKPINPCWHFKKDYCLLAYFTTLNIHTDPGDTNNPTTV